MLILFLLISSAVGLEPCSNNSNANPKICYLNKDPPLLKPEGYNSVSPTIVSQSVTLYSIGDFDELKSTITLNFLLTVFWNDSRLSMNPPASWLSIDKDVASKIFFPTIKFLNIKSMKREGKYGVVDKDPFWMEYPHYFEHQKALEIELYCHFDFQNFPFDHHHCLFAFGSSELIPKFLTFNPTRIRYENVLKICIDQSENVSVKQNRLPFEISLSCIMPFIQFEAGFDHSYAGIEINFTRNSFGTLIGGFYIPTGIFAYLSLISFSIDVNMVNIKIRSFYTELNSLIEC